MNEDGFKYSKGDRVLLTFEEARGERGVVVDVGFKFNSPTSDAGYEYADVLLDSTGERTGPMPITCVMHDGAPPEESSPMEDLPDGLIHLMGMLELTKQGIGLVAFTIKDLTRQGKSISDLPDSHPIRELPSQLETCADGLEEGVKVIRAMAKAVRQVH